MSEKGEHVKYGGRSIGEIKIFFNILSIALINIIFLEMIMIPFMSCQFMLELLIYDGSTILLVSLIFTAALPCNILIG